MQIHQLNPPIEVKTPHGVGLAILVIDYGWAMNTCWCVALNASGIVKHYDSNEITLTPNYTWALFNGEQSRSPLGEPR